MLFWRKLAALLLLSNLLGLQAGSRITPDIEARIQRVIATLRAEQAYPGQNGREQTLSDRMAYYHAPGVSIAVVNNHEIEWARGFGVREHGKSAKVTATTLFQAGSISKPVFALAVMRLAQAGKLNLDENVNHGLKSWKLPPVDLWQPRVTLQQLLSHTAGTTVHGFNGYLRTERLPTVVDILSGQLPANNARVVVNLLPGTQIRYSSGGTLIAQQLVVDTLGKPFPSLMREWVLDPLGMSHSTYEQPLPGKWARSTATGHTWKNQPVPGQWLVYPEMAAQGLWTTPSDLASAGIAVQLALEGQSTNVISGTSAWQMVTPRLDPQIGIGFFLSGDGEGVRFGHGGWNEGFVAQMTFLRRGGQGAVIMVNSIEATPLLAELERAIAWEYEWPGYVPESRTTVPPSPQALDEFAGEYMYDNRLRFVVTRSELNLWLRVQDQAPIELLHLMDDVFVTRTLASKIIFQRNAEGKIEDLILQQEGHPILAKRK